jgi:outer membrane protein OmpA-like peptidoglycan-associated protein
MSTRREARGLVVNLSDVLFDFGKADLRQDARESLAKVAGVLHGYPLPAELMIEGHTDSVGSDESNLTLSQKRAEAVRDYLIQSGISPDMIVATRGFGKTRPIASNDTEEGRSRNRRVEIIVDDDLSD